VPKTDLRKARYQYEHPNRAAPSSSPYDQRLPTSPVVSASRSRSAVTDQAYRRPHIQPAQLTQPSYSQPVTGPSFNDAEDDDEYGGPFPTHTLENADTPATRARTHKAPTRDTPVVQGIALVSTQKLPDRFRSIFPFPLFNAVQSKCFPIIYGSNDNFVLSSPTSSGKTAVLELAICRMMNGFANGSYKVVYQAPTKSLCSERQRDWQRKFGPLDLQVAELTGDRDNAQLRSVANASIIITTPEKWDSITRKWKDHQKLMQMVKLFLIDEVHILKEDRGATLEAIVSRMKYVGCDIRFVALSATVPNSQDIATWLGKDSVTPYLPAPREQFGEEFRPVPLAKHVCGYQSSGNDFAFEKTLNIKLPDIIARWSQRKPIMVFCFTRSSCVETAKQLAKWWATKGLRDRYWEAPTKHIAMEDKELRGWCTPPSLKSFY
jgi:ATP-dependent DNA helicase HFM1/MER3